MGAFQSGFSQGGQMYQQALDNKDRQAIRERQAIEAQQRDTLFGQQQAEYQRQVGLQTQGDALRDQLLSPNKGNYALPPAAAPQGLRMPTDSMPAGQGLGIDMSAPGADISAPQSTGLRRTTAAATPATFNQAPTGAAAQDIIGQIEALKGNFQGYNQAQDRGRQFKFEDAYKSGYEGFKASDPDARNKLLDEFSAAAHLPGKAVYVQGTGKSKGYTQILLPDGKMPKLNDEEAAQVAGMLQASAVDPLRAREMINKLQGDARTVAMAIEDHQLKQVTASNTSTYQQQNAESRLDRAQAAIDRAAAASSRGDQWHAVGGPIQTIGADGKPALEIPMMGPNGQGKSVTIPLNGSKFMKMPPELTPVQQDGLKEINRMLIQNPNLPQAQVDALYARIGVPNPRGGAGGIQGSWDGTPAPAAPAAPAQAITPPRKMSAKEQAAAARTEALKRALPGMPNLPQSTPIEEYNPYEQNRVR
jgi:hypothetical protein